MGNRRSLSYASMKPMRTGTSPARTGLRHRSRRGPLLVALLLAIDAVPLAADLPRELDGVLAAVPHARTKTGACVIDLNTGRTLYSRGADTALIPASTMKLFAMAVAIQELGSDFGFETRLATDGVNLYVVGDGDPAFGDPKLALRRDEPIDAAFHRWARRLRDAGTDNIPGGLVLDTSVFDEKLIHPTWETEDLSTWYAAPVGALNFNDNCVDITLSPRGPGLPAEVDVSPEAPVIRVINKTRSGGKGSPVLHHTPFSHEYTVSGRCSKTWRFGPASFPEPALLFGEALRAAFARESVTFSGTIGRAVVRRHDGSLRPELVVLATHRTALPDALRRAGKNSQNLFADALWKRAGYAWSRRNEVFTAIGS